jgi:hypothetical protein
LINAGAIINTGETEFSAGQAFAGADDQAVSSDQRVEDPFDGVLIRFLPEVGEEIVSHEDDVKRIMRGQRICQIMLKPGDTLS